jgi:uncharacterized iron-regulated membrane protein
MNRGAARRIWIATHRYLGLATVGFLLIAAITGCLLCARASIDAALNPDLFRTDTTGAALAPMVMAERLERARPDLLVTALPLRTRPGSTTKVTVAARDPAAPIKADQIFLDPHDAHVVGARRSGPGLDRRHIVDAIYALHFTLLAGRWGRWLMGVVALAWLIGNLVGLYLTFPAGRPLWPRWRVAWLIHIRAGLGRLWLDVHRASGLWLLIGLTVLAFTSVSMNFFDEAVTPIMAAISPARPSPFDHPARRPSPPAAGAAGFRAALAAANRVAGERGLTWTPAVATFVADRGLYGVMFTPTGYETYQGLGPVTYYFGGSGARFVYADDPYHDSPGRMFSRALFPLHSGEAAGPPGSAVVCVLGLAAVQQGLTGVYIWWTRRRPRGWAQRRRAPVAEADGAAI